MGLLENVDVFLSKPSRSNIIKLRKKDHQSMTEGLQKSPKVRKTKAIPPQGEPSKDFDQKPVKQKSLPNPSVRRLA